LNLPYHFSGGFVSPSSTSVVTPSHNLNHRFNSQTVNYLETSVFVRNVPESISDEVLKNFFSKAGEVGINICIM
jgi:RNA recognition motif-containing protein